MEKIKNFSFKNFLKILKWVFLILLVLYLIVIVWRVFDRRNAEKTDIEVMKIHSTKLSIDDVMGVNLPPDPGELADATVEGVDANQNGIRDDVELAIFKEYPNSAKTRAVLLQYALALQMETTEKIINTTTVTEIVTEQGRADTCLADTLVPRKTPESSRETEEIKKIDSYVKFIENIQFNSEIRKEARNDFLKNLRSFGDSTNQKCDIDVSKLRN